MALFSLGLTIAVFVSPETILSTEWRDLLSDSTVKRRIVMVAVDEAHCISECVVPCHNLVLVCTLNRGDNFRPSFSLLGGLRALVKAPFMALTASAPPSVQSEISSSLFLVHPVVVSRNLDRRNIFLSASPIKSLNVCF